MKIIAANLQSGAITSENNCFLKIPINFNGTEYEIANITIDDIIIRKEDCQFDNFDIIYSTRLQKERTKSGEREDIIIDNKLMKDLKSNAINANYD